MQKITPFFVGGGKNWLNFYDLSKLQRFLEQLIKEKAILSPDYRSITFEYPKIISSRLQPPFASLAIFIPDTFRH